MRILHRFYFLLFFLLTAALANAQTCTGSLGDPVIHEDFGSGTGIGPALPAGVTNYLYASKDCPDDSWYSIVNKIDDCFFLSWHNIRDASNVPNGYFMLVNADANPGIFYTQRADASQFCASTTYEFAAMVANVMRTSACNNGGIRPNLTFRIETETGALVKKFDSGDLPPDGIWRKYGTFFTLTSNASLIVKIINNAPGGCGNDLALDDITFRACGPQISTTYNGGISTPNIEICEGVNNTYVITAAAPADYQNFQWQHMVNGAWQNIPGETGNSYNVPPTGSFAAGVYQYRVATVSNGNIGSLNCRIFSEPTTITVNPIPVVSPPPDQFICFGSTVQLTASGGNAYVWSGPGLPATATNTLTISNAGPANEGIYTVYTISDRGCPSPSAQFNVTVLPPIISTVTPSAEICLGSNINLQATGGSTYQWTPAAGLSATNISNPVANPTQTTTYTVRIGNGACFDEKQVTVTVLKPPVATAPAAKRMFEDESITLDAAATGDNIVETSWSPVTYLDNPSSLTPKASPTEDITYTLTVRSATCGISTSSVFIRVYKKVYVPNTFTPNGDTFNDVWNIRALDTYPESTTAVFSRAGQEVFRTSGYGHPWDGTYNGQLLPAGTYYYVINLNNGTKPLTGWVALLK